MWGPRQCVVKQRHLGMQVHSSLKVLRHVQTGWRRRCVACLLSLVRALNTRVGMLQLYKTFVGPHLEYCAQFSLPCYKMDVIKLERVQKRFARPLPGLEG